MTGSNPNDLTEHAIRRREISLLLVLASVQFTSIVDFMVVMPLAPQLELTLGIDADRFGLVVASYTLSAGLAGLLASTVLDRFGRRRAYLSLFSGFLVGTLLCGLSFNYATLLGARIVTGAFGGILGGMALAIIGDVFPEERRGQATGILMSAFALASVVGVPVVPGPGNAVRLARALPDPGGLGSAHPACWPCGSCRRSAITSTAGPMRTRGAGSARPSARPITSGPSPSPSRSCSAASR